MNKISFAIITKNEELNLYECLENIKDIADEIVIIDSFSTDRTKEIAAKYNVKFIERNFTTFAQQKQISVDESTHDLVFCIDADEQLDDTLKEEIRKIKVDKKNRKIFSVKRKNFDGKHWIRFGGFYPDIHVRLFDKSEACWGGPNPHEKVVYNPQITPYLLNGNILHKKKYDQTEYNKLIGYAKAFAKNAYQNRLPLNKAIIKRLISPVWTFVSIYFLKLGFLEGTLGYKLANWNLIYTKKKYQFLKNNIEEKKIERFTNVLIDCERMKYPNTGIYTYCEQISYEIPKSKQRKMEKYYFYINKDATMIKPFYENNFLTKIYHKIRLNVPGRFNIYHSTIQTSDYFPLKRKGLKIIMTIHDLNFLIEKENERKKQFYLKNIQKKILKCDHIICISDFVKQQIIDNLEIDESIITRIYNGTSVKRFPNFDSPNYRPKGKFLFAIGTVLPKKNFHVGVNLLVGNDYQLIIAGIQSKIYVKKILQLAVKLGVSERVILSGPIDEKNKYWYLKNCEAFIFPSLAEGFGLPVLEAMHFGKPCFLSTHCSLPEIGGSHAYYFKNFQKNHMISVFKEGLEDYHNNPDKPNEIIHWAKSFSWEKTAEEYTKVYQKVVGNN